MKELAATAASRLRAPKLRALREFHVQCSSLTPAGVVWGSLRRAAAVEGAEAHDLQSGEVSGACRSGRRRWGARSAVRRRGDVFLGACRRGRRRGGLQLYQIRAAWGDTGQLSGIWLGLWVSASGGAAQSASIFIENALVSVTTEVLMMRIKSCRASGSDREECQRWKGRWLSTVT